MPSPKLPHEVKRMIESMAWRNLITFIVISLPPSSRLGFLCYDWYIRKCRNCSLIFLRVRRLEMAYNDRIRSQLPHRRYLRRESVPIVLSLLCLVFQTLTREKSKGDTFVFFFYMYYGRSIPNHGAKIYKFIDNPVAHLEKLLIYLTKGYYGQPE